jgi:hypothetical protein
LFGAANEGSGLLDGHKEIVEIEELWEVFFTQQNEGILGILTVLQTEDRLFTT